jgi:hypothetical protein
MPVSHAGKSRETHQADEKPIFGHAVCLRREVGDRSIEARRREIVEQIRVIPAQMLSGERDLVHARRGGSHR